MRSADGLPTGIMRAYCWRLRAWPPNKPLGATKIESRYAADQGAGKHENLFKMFRHVNAKDKNHDESQSDKHQRKARSEVLLEAETDGLHRPDSPTHRTYNWVVVLRFEAMLSDAHGTAFAVTCISAGAGGSAVGTLITIDHCIDWL